MQYLMNRRRRLLSGSFSPAFLFAAGEQGVWFEPDAADQNWRRNIATQTDDLTNRVVFGVTTSLSGPETPQGATSTVVTKSSAFQFARVQLLSGLAAGSQYTVSIFVRAGSLADAGLAIITDAGARINRVSFDLATGTTSLIQALGGAGPTVTHFEDLGDWKRIGITATTGAANGDVFFYPGIYTATTTGDVFAGAVQVELSSAPTDYQRIRDLPTELRERFPRNTTFTDEAGTTPAQVGQAVALMLDKSKGLALGPELVTNGTFDATSDWTLTSGYSITGGQLVFSGASGLPATQFNVLSQNKVYDVIVDVAEITSGVVSLGLGLNIFQTLTVGRNVVRRYFTETDTRVRFVSGGTSPAFKIDNISVRELPGNHATQPTLASRPILGRVPARGRVNLLNFSEPSSDAQTTNRDNITYVSGFDGFSSAIQFGDNSVLRFAYVGPALLPSTVYTLSVFVRMDDGGVPDLGISPLSGDFRLQIGNSGANTVNSGVQDLGGGLYRVFRAGPSASTSSANTGVVKFTDGSARGFRVTGYQLELGDVTPSAYQKVTDQFDVTEAGQPNNFYLFHGGSGNPRWMQTPSIDFTGTDKVTVWSGVRKLSEFTSESTSAMIAETSANSNNTNGSFGLSGSIGFNTGRRYQYLQRGSQAASAFTTDAAFSAPHNAVLTGIGDISGDNVTLRVNGAQVAQNTADQGTGNFGSHPLFIGTRGGTSLFLNGHIHSLLVRGALTDTPTIERTERYVASKTAGVSIP